MSKPTVPTTRDRADLWEALSPLIIAMHAEFKDLSKKQPEGPVSKRKIAAANRLLVQCRDVLIDELTIDFLDLLDEDDLPLNSDVVLVMSQYVAAMQGFHTRHHGVRGMDFGWYTE